MNLRSSWVAETGQTREDTRLNQIGATTPVNPVQIRSGILPGSYSGQFRLSGFWMSGSAAMSATIADGRAVIQGDISQGVYPVSLPTSQTVTFAAGNDQYARVDLVVLRVYDNLYDGLTRNEATIEVLQGKPDPTPQAPQIPARSLALYEVTVPAGASAGNGGIPWNTALKDLRTPVVSVGGILPVEGQVFPGAYPGQFQDSGGALQRWDGGAWVPYPSALGGIIPNSASTLTASYTGQYRDSAGGQLQRWNGSAWAPAVPGPYFTGSNDAGYTTSTTYTPTLLDKETTNPVTLTFTAPPSKAVLISFGSRSLSASADHYAYISVKVTQGSTVVWEPDDERSAVCASVHYTSVGTVQRLTNLTPGASYSITVMHRVVANTLNLKAWFDNVYLRVDPQN
ncbi:hypothetical protein [Streptomyces vilmorinianum]|uniref:hypothetical protein n=1 Tax=Streptomyces vilmorinianum TaxID=3051092 RepID=UPI0010FB6D8E|nr:hypothetical protein [Streptomyces vilmorinianum]